MGVPEESEVVCLNVTDEWPEPEEDRLVWRADVGGAV
jgi:hypothetical protein